MRLETKRKTTVYQEYLHLHIVYLRVYRQVDCQVLQVEWQVYYSHGLVSTPGIVYL